MNVFIGCFTKNALHRVLYRVTNAEDGRKSPVRKAKSMIAIIAAFGMPRFEFARQPLGFFDP